MNINLSSLGKHWPLTVAAFVFLASLHGLVYVVVVGEHKMVGVEMSYIEWSTVCIIATGFLVSAIIQWRKDKKFNEAWSNYVKYLLGR